MRRNSVLHRQWSVARRFDDFVEPEPNTGCWLWNGSLDTYGTFFWGRNMGAHRASWMLHRGEIPRGLHVLHRCDVPACVNPDHLWLGTRSENMRDCIRKGRHRRAVAA